MNLQATLLVHADIKLVTDLLGWFTQGFCPVYALWVQCDPTGLQGPAVPGSHFLNVLSDYSLIVSVQSLWVPILRFQQNWATVLLDMAMSLKVSETCLPTPLPPKKLEYTGHVAVTRTRGMNHGLSHLCWFCLGDLVLDPWCYWVYPESES